MRGVRTDGGLPPPFLGMPLVGRYIVRAVVGSGLSGDGTAFAATVAILLVLLLVILFFFGVVFVAPLE
ncbi:MAG: hypothetical protein M0T85_13760 [Dehalococcoidales bacterium]|nr:hypothetical protein [Dehalococcoidales bacterium]